MITVSTSNEAYHHGNLRDALLAAGLEALEGADGKPPSLRELARKVGVSATAVYRHFPDKNALDKALAMEGLRIMGARQKSAGDKVGGGSAGFAEAGKEYVRFALTHPALFRLMFTQGEPIDRSDEEDPARALLTQYSQSLTTDPKRAESLALQAWAIVHGIAMLMLDGRIPADDTLLDRLLATDTLFSVTAS